MFLATLVGITVVLITMLHWIQPLSKFGRLEETTHRIEQAAIHIIQKRIDHPCLGEKLLEDTEKIPDNAQLLYSDKTVYIEHIDIAALSRCMKDIEGETSLMNAPRDFVYPAFVKTLYESGPSLMQATLEFVRMRLHPITMTALTFILGVTPLMIATGVGSGAQNAIDTGVFGGMFAAKLLAIFFIPEFFVMVFRFAEKLTALPQQNNIRLQEKWHDS